MIEASKDGENGPPLADDSATPCHGLDDWPAIRYPRLIGLPNLQNNYVAVSELEVHGIGPPIRRTVQISVSESVGPVMGVTRDDVTSVNGSGWAAMDGNPGTAWAGPKAGGGCIVLEFVQTMSLRRLEVNSADGSLSSI